MSHVLRPTAMTGRPLPAARHLRGRAARTRAAARLVAAAVLLAQLAACAPGPATPPATPPLVLAERQTWGGLCPEGPCGSTLTVRDDGTWSWTDEATDVQGRVSPRAVDTLREAIDHTALMRVGTPGEIDGIDGKPVPTPAPWCDAHADGSSVRYGWASPGEGWRVVDSCEQTVDPLDPLVVHLEELARRLAP